jgi:D-alanyl-lipoteichoic acid acyltransferase DltB (MBOAT superfamily)
MFPRCEPLPTNSLYELEIMSLVSLMFLWYKFIVIWRWAKAWSYLSGIEVIDNMNRCMFNNYGFEGFWRMWHRGYNLWLVRYLFVPFGGNKTFWSYVAVFAFVAFWHDPELKMVLWVVCIIPFMVPELLVKNYFRKHHKNLFGHYWFKYLSALGGGVYIYLMCIANLIGFGYGY